MAVLYENQILLGLGYYNGHVKNNDFFPSVLGVVVAPTCLFQVFLTACFAYIGPVDDIAGVFDWKEVVAYFLSLLELEVDATVVGIRYL